ncbi:hypothetical protein HanHA300_Chr00c0061g0700231 [Helianthus annuus]|nr:hypothetical protein HanIR_Chr03g0101901 [Helianthus annuus]KAJ0638689.1 hypothetical protein HanHA300_Chr00c0061g0700231 [Helianthus annuus]KAJ0766871.1 hypothetical protein HanLR1_Chr03g0082581 [Helianthus annuus]KAJ0772731.1 hypothetical protein HanOQP8_Chr03g0090791 [Helianthus annuus]KAJ0942246.1 hypothetical protein HanPSC8_Chr03g0089721 [Helianthus annuus]
MLAIPVSQEWGLMALRMMMRWKPGSKQKPVCRENDRGSLVALGVHLAAVDGGKAQKCKRQEKPVTLVTKQAGTGIFYPRKTQPEDYVLVSDTLEGLDILGATLGTGGAGESNGPLIVKKRKVAGAPAGTPSKKIALRRQKMESLKAYGAQPSFMFFFSFVVVSATTVLPPPPTSSPPSMPTGDVRRVEEPEHTIQAENVAEPAPSRKAEVPVTELLGETMIHDDILDTFDNVIDSTRGLTEGGGAHAQTSPHFEYAFGSGTGGGGDPNQTPIQPNETPLEYYFRTYNEVCDQAIHSPMEYKTRG